MYLSELDHFLHEHCEDGNEVGKQLAWYEDQLREVFDTARDSDGGVSLTVFSDHGMTPVSNHFDLVNVVDLLGLTMPADYLAVYDSTMARFWFFNDQARRMIVDMLDSLDCGRILSDDELGQLGILFPDRRYGEVVFLLHPGWILTRSDFHGKGWTPKGMHGYHPDDPFSDAVFLSSRQPSREMRKISDVFHHMLEAVQ